MTWSQPCATFPEVPARDAMACTSILRFAASSAAVRTASDVLLVDGMRLQGNRINSQLNNVEQIDVLKGPSSILYGGQALSGAVNVIRKKPEATPAYDLFYRVGRFNTHQVGGGATGQVFGLDRLLYRADVSYENTDG